MITGRSEQGTQLHEVFISYGRADEAVARRFATALEDEGLAVWWDDTLRTGDIFDEAIESALRQAAAVVVLWSPTSVLSRWVRSEATIGDRQGMLAPVMIAPCERPIMFELTQTSDLIDWNGDTSDIRWRSFVSDLRGVVARRRAGPSSEDRDALPKPVPPAPSPAMPTRKGEDNIPSLGVLPFKNRSGLAEDDVFAIGLVEDVIDALSQAAELRVISSSATARFRHGEIADVAAMAHSLGVRYILEGNIRRRGTILRVTAQLLDATTATILWTQKFERPLEELAELEEELVLEVAVNLNSQVNRLEMERALRKPANLTAWELVTRAIANYRQITGETLLLALQDARTAVEIAPSYGLAHAMLADANATIYMYSMPDDPAVVRQINAEIATALALDPDNPLVLAHIAEAYNYIGQPNDALVYARKALQRSPNFGLAHYNAGIAHALLGHSNDALEHFDRDLAVAPGSHTQFATYAWRGSVFLRDGDYANARHDYHRSTQVSHDSSAGYLGLFLVDMLDGSRDAARAHWTAMRNYDPEMTLDGLCLRLRRWFKDPPLGDTFCGWAQEFWADNSVA